MVEVYIKERDFEMKRKLSSIILIFAIIFSAVSYTPVLADKKTDAEDKLSSIEAELEAYEAKQKELQLQIDTLSKDKSNYDKLRYSLEKKISNMIFFFNLKRYI